MTKLRKNTIKALSFIGAFCLLSGAFLGNFKAGSTSVDGASVTPKKLSESIDDNRTDFYDKNVVYKLPDTVQSNDEISLIIKTNVESVMDAYAQTDGKLTVTEYVSTKPAKYAAMQVARENQRLINVLNKSGVKYTLGDEYDTILSGFEISVKAKDFDKVSKLLSADATVIVGDEYAPAETQIVTNEVDVYETGIFDSSSSEYQGDGVVVAVLDTGLDYTHTAFSVDNFTTTNEALTLQNVSQKVDQTVAAGFTKGLTGEDVYLNKKVPYAYDYADKDPDVLPINSEHGTHVAGIIAGKDDTITGVAPNAQLAIMKVFSDTSSGAKTSHILSALEDCVIIGVDVINMSLGTSCGFTREVDRENINVVYDKIKEAGISLIAAASNDYNATFGSDKNGSNGLTSNPDSGTVGSPSTYPASLSVASVNGVKTPYMLSGGDIIYFTEASTSTSSNKHFVDDILATVGDVDEYEFEYVTVPGIGRSSDYSEPDEYYKGKIVLVKRGTTTFEDKVRVALTEKGASGIIIYNNISGTISMTVGKAVGAVCSIAQDEGEKLAAVERGTIKISRKQVAGPFMSDFSSWGPTSDLKIKPEITAHGGEILSAVPGQGYERLSGTSMAAPNQAGAAALIRQYVKYSGTFGSDLSTKEVTALVNRVMMSTADIVYNKNGLPYAVRKQGAGLININKAVTSAAYITTYEQDGETAMDKTKIEFGDDKTKSGVYETTFSIENVSNKAVSYDISAMIQTEGVSETYTSHGDTTVTQDGYTLSGATVTVNGGDNKTVSVDAKSSQKVTVKITLSDADKKYLDQSFKYGMYVEGFIVLKATAGTTVNMNVPLLAFYGDWTQAPIFDEEYYDTNKDEINAGIDPEDKLMADAYATRVVGGLYSDYITMLGTYAFIQDPSTTQIAADKDKISISNQNNDEEVTVNSIYSVYAGLLRNAKEVDIKIVEDSTGKTIYEATEYNQMKSYSHGSSIYASSIDVKFGALEHNLKNNTKYTVTLEAFIDYGEKSEQKNVRNKFEFPLYVDFEAPVVTGVKYRKEYDKTTKKTQLFADVDIYDNHYAMAAQFGQIVRNEETGRLVIKSFNKYLTPVYSQRNSTSTVTFDVTDYVADIKKSVGNDVLSTSGGLVNNSNSFVVTCYDYAQNAAMYEINLPDDVLSMYFSEESVSLSPNETLEIGDILNIYPEESWLQTLDFSTSDSNIISIVNQTIIAKNSGTATLTAVGTDNAGKKVQASVQVKVLAPGEEGYNGGYTVPEVNKFSLTQYEVIKAYYSTLSSEREIGFTGGIYQFGSSQNLSMYPSESVKIQYSLDSYFPERTAVTYKSGNDRVATVTADGTIVAQAEGSTIITVGVTFDGKTTLYSERVGITVKDPFITNSIYLTAYRGLGGTVTIPDDRGLTTINAYAFCGYESVEKDPDQGDIIDEEDPYYTKQMYLGDDTITKIIIPEGITTIEEYAFANLTALEEVVLPESLNKIGKGAFYGCEKLKKINLEKVKFINERAFYNTALEVVDLSSVVAIGNYTFAKTKLSYVVLPTSSQSLGVGAFANNEYLTSVEFKASKIKIGSNVFSGCNNLSSIDINAAVISSYAFADCTSLTRVNLGRDVAVIGEFAFGGTNVSAFTIDARNRNLTLKANGALVYKGDELLLAAPKYAGDARKIVTISDATSIGNGAFAGNSLIKQVVANNVERVGAYAFAMCTQLTSVTMNSVVEIGDFAFALTALTATPSLENVKSIGNSAFYYTAISSVTVSDGTVVGDRAFAYCGNLQTATLGDNVKIGTMAFYCPYEVYSIEFAEDLSNYNFNLFYTPYEYQLYDIEGNFVRTLYFYSYNYKNWLASALTTVSIGDNCEIGTRAFAWTAIENLTLGSNAVIGDYAFYSVAGITGLDLSTAKKIGEGAFSGYAFMDLWCENNEWYFANEMVVFNGEEYLLGRIYTSTAPAIEQADLSGLTELGLGAFANNFALTSVTLGNGITEVADSAFYNATSLTSITLPDGITKIGAGAFANTALEEINLSKIDEIGDEAFSGTPLTSVELKDGVKLGEGAFANCEWLEEVKNLKNASSIGAYAFMNTSLTEVDLSGVTKVGDYAFANSYVTKVILGEKLESFGENPFYNCNVVTFGKMEEVKFGNNVVGETLTETYDASATVKVIGGVLYQVVPNGLELVCYPFGATAKEYTVEEGTVRISANAFANNKFLQSVTLPLSLKSLGDKAFYGCEKLSLVVFKSYNAPILEEEYNENYTTMNNLPLTGYYSTVSGTVYQGLGIAPYYMWNLSNTNFYYGANFVNYVGKVSNNLVMVKPVNGQGYDTFILSQYFGATVQGSPAATDVTLKVIAMIAALPSDISLEDEDAVMAARAAFDALTLEQQSLVTNAKVLTDAEATINYLKSIQPAPEEPVDKENGFVKFLKNNYVGLIIAAVCLAALVAYIVVTQVKGKKKAATDGEAAKAAEPAEEPKAAETTEQPVPEEKAEEPVAEPKAEELPAEEKPAEEKPKKTQAKKSKTKKSEAKPDTTEKDEKDI